MLLPALQDWQSTWDNAGRYLSNVPSAHVSATSIMRRITSNRGLYPSHNDVYPPGITADDEAAAVCEAAYEPIDVGCNGIELEGRALIG